MTHAAAATTTATIGAETHMRLKAMYDFNMGNHVIFPGEFLIADRAGVVFDVRLVRGDVVPAEIADVCVRAVTHGAPVNVALFHAEISHRALCTLVLSFKRAFEIALTDFRLASHHAKYGTTYAVL